MLQLSKICTSLVWDCCFNWLNNGLCLNPCSFLPGLNINMSDMAKIVFWGVKSQVKFTFQRLNILLFLVASTHGSSVKVGQFHWKTVDLATLINCSIRVLLTSKVHLKWVRRSCLELKRKRKIKKYSNSHIISWLHFYSFW